MFIAIEGCDGSGKGAQIDFLKSWFKNEGLRVEFFHDPGSTRLSEAIRELLLNNADVAFTQRAEMGLFMASRSQLVMEKILPALHRDKIVLVDRYLLSTVVYQGYAYDADAKDIDAIWRIGKYMAHNVLPDLTFVLNCSAESALRRLNRPKDRIEQKTIDYHERVVQGYQKAVRDWKRYAPGRVFLVDAERSPEEVFNDIATNIVGDSLLRSNEY